MGEGGGCWAGMWGRSWIEQCKTNRRWDKKNENNACVYPTRTYHRHVKTSGRQTEKRKEKKKSTILLTTMQITSQLNDNKTYVRHTKKKQRQVYRLGKIKKTLTKATRTRTEQQT